MGFRCAWRGVVGGECVIPVAVERGDGAAEQLRLSG
jgi:hypothetical protein